MNSTRIYLDSNVFIYALEGTNQTAQAPMALLNTLGERPGMGVTSELTLAEILVIPRNVSIANLRQQYLDLLVFSGVFDLRPVSRDILIDSAKYRLAMHPGKPEACEDRRNFLPDAIYVVTAHRSSCRYFVARDKQLKLPGNIAQVTPDMSGISDLLRVLS